MRYLLKVLILFSFLTGSEISISQNLVPNPGFEDTLNCSISMPYIQHAYPWFNPTISTPDYFTTIPGCGYNWSTLPINRSPRTGIAFSGIFCWDGSGQREYIETKLLDTLIAGKKYNVSFYVVRSFDSRYATDKIGVHFSADSLLSSTALNIPVIPQVYNTSGIIYDTSNWVNVTGSFIAQGGELFLIIGNFFNNQNCMIDSGNGNFYAGYYYLDDIAVTIDSATGLNEIDQCILYKISTIQAEIVDKCSMNLLSDLNIKMFDMQGRLVKQFDTKNSSEAVNIKFNDFAFSRGLYLLRISNKTSSKSFKLIF